MQADDDVYIRAQGNENAIKCIGNGSVELYHNNSSKLVTKSDGVEINGRCYPEADATYDLGATGKRWNNIYTNDLHLSNESKKDTGGNDVDGTWGDWTLQEGEDKIFMINNRTGKRYSIIMKEEN